MLNHDVASDDHVPTLPTLERGVVLLVEDEEGLREILRSALELAGMQVIACRKVSDAVEYLEAARAYPDRASGGALPVPDVVLCDMHLPDGTGFDLLRSVNEVSGAGVVTMTAYGDPELHRLAQRMGARRSLDKPFSLDQLLGAIAGARPT